MRAKVEVKELIAQVSASVLEMLSHAINRPEVRFGNILSLVRMF